MATHATHTLRPGKGRHAGSRRRIRIDEHLPVDHRLSRVYRIGAGLMGLFLLVFGIFGLIDKVGWFDTRGDTVAGGHQQMVEFDRHGRLAAPAQSRKLSNCSGRS